MQFYLASSCIDTTFVLMLHFGDSCGILPSTLWRCCFLYVMLITQWLSTFTVLYSAAEDVRYNQKPEATFSSLAPCTSLLSLIYLGDQFCP